MARITTKAWNNYISVLRRLSDRASTEMLAMITQLSNQYSEGRITLEEYEDLAIDYAYALATKYGEAAGAAACEMYDAIAALQSADVPPAVPAETATVAETAKAVKGTMKTGNLSIVADATGRLVKLAGVDTMQQNALRDGAEWAWIPHGDTCAFCLTLASRGWQKASKNAIKNGHAEHVHANCDCTFAVRFNNDLNVQGYDPQAYLDMYYDADGNTPKQRINAMRREFYAENKEKFREQSRELYRKKHNTGAFKDLEEPMMLKHVKSIAEDMNLDMGKSKFKIDRSEELIGSGYYGVTSDDGKIVTLFPDAFTTRETLVKTMGHENVHLQQIRINGKITSLEQLAEYEKEAVDSEERWWKQYVKNTGYRRE